MQYASAGLHSKDSLGRSCETRRPRRTDIIKTHCISLPVFDFKIRGNFARARTTHAHRHDASFSSEKNRESESHIRIKIKKSGQCARVLVELAVV